MEALALYLIKSTVWLTGFALVYLLFLRNERFFVLNRIYLVTGILGSIVFPFFTWHYTVMMPNAPTVEVSDLQMVGTVDIAEPFPTQAILLYIYLAGALYLLYRVIRQTMSVLKVIRKSAILPYRSAKLIRTTEYPSSFSFFSFVFVNPSTCDTETNEIVNHELEHVRQQHWIDLLLFECLCTLQWYNPMSWLYGRFIRQNHEYLADERALQRTANPAIYRAALLNQMFGGPVITLANSFNYSINKKRFNMMKQTIYSPIRKFKLLLILPLMAGVFYAFATPEYKYNQAEVISVQDEVLTNPDSTSQGSVTTLNGNFVPNVSKDTTSASGLNYKAKNVQGTYKNGIEKLKAEAISIDAAKTTSLVFIDGKESTKDKVDQLNPERIESVSILKGASATNKYGEKGKGGVIEISLKKGTNESENLNSATSQTLKLQSNSPLKFGNADGSSVQPLIVKDGVITGLLNVNNISPETIESINVLKGTSAINKYGSKGKDGVIEITMKKGTSKNEPIDLKIDDGATQKKESGVYSVVEQMPEFPGGADALRTFIAANVRYPALAHEKGIQGKVFIQFVVTQTGSVSNAKVVRGVDALLDQEAIRVVESLPNWIPGKQNGENVDVSYTIPIEFKLESSKISTEERKSTNTPSDQPYSVVEQMPEFPGGPEALRTFIANTVRYPALAHENGIQGKVYIQFVVTKTGNVSNAKVVRGVDPLLDNEALRVVNLLPTWIPGKQKGENVNVNYTIPINFKLPEELRNANNKAIGVARVQAPEFPGGKEAFKTFIATSLRYPEIALANGIHGQVFVKFTIDKTGAIYNVRTSRGVDASLDQEAERIIKSMPRWIPGNQNGENVAVAMEIPITFKFPVDYNPVDANIKKEKLRVPYQPKIMQKEQVAQNHELIIVPNPTSNKATITLKDSDSTNKLKIGVYDSYGKLMIKESKIGPSFTLSVAKLTTGTYLVVATDGTTQYQGHLVVNH